MMGDANNQQRAGGLTVPQVARILPGPAGRLQQLAAAGALHQATPELLGLKDQYISSTQNINILADPCFQSVTWTEANGFASSQDSQLYTVKMAKELSLGKVPLIVVVLGAILPSGLSSAFCKVKDPTGSIGTAFHGSVLQQQQYQQGRLVPGTVVLLQQVSVFTPAPGVSYLAVTATNIVKVWSGESAANRIRHDQHQPAQQQHQQQEQQRQGQEKRQQEQQTGANQTEHLHGTSKPPGRDSQAANAVQSKMQTQQEQLQQRRQQQQCSPSSMAGSNRSSLFPPPSPDVSSIFGRPQRQPDRQHHRQNLHSQRFMQQQTKEHALNQAADDERRVCGGQSGRDLVLQQQQRRQAATPQGRGLMLPPAPRLHASNSHKPLQHQQQQTHSTNVELQPPFHHSSDAQQHTSSMQPQLLDSLIEDLEGLEEEDDGQADGAADHTAAAAAGTGLGMHRGPGPAAVLQPHLLQDQQQAAAAQQQTSSQFVPSALLQQITGRAATSARRLSVTPSTAASSSGGAAAAAAVAGDQGCIGPVSAAVDEGEDAVDDVIAAIFGSQMAPAAAPVRNTTPRQAAAAAASIFGSQLAAPAAPRPPWRSTTQPNSTLAGPAQPGQQQMPPPRTSGAQQGSTGLLRSSAPASSKAGCLLNSSDTGASTGNRYGGQNDNALSRKAVIEHEQPSQKRLKASTAVHGAALQPTQPLRRYALSQQPADDQQQRGSLPQQWSAGWPAAHSPAPGVTQPTAAQPAVSGVYMKGAGAACLLDDLINDELEELDCF